MLFIWQRKENCTLNCKVQLTQYNNCHLESLCLKYQRQRLPWLLLLLVNACLSYVNNGEKHSYNSALDYKCEDCNSILCQSVHCRQHRQMKHEAADTACGLHFHGHGRVPVVCIQEKQWLQGCARENFHWNSNRAKGWQAFLVLERRGQEHWVERRTVHNWRMWWKLLQSHFSGRSNSRG